MKAVVLVAGKGTRMAKDYEGPKQLMDVAGKPVIEYMFEALPEEVVEIILVVGGPHEQTIREHFKAGEWQGIPIRFVVQKEQLGLAHAFATAEEFIEDRWLGLIADDIIGQNDLKRLVKNKLGVLAAHTDHPENFGILVADDEGYLTKAVEKPKEFVSDLASTACMVMDRSFFDLNVEPSARGEYETPDVWMKMIEELGAKIKIVAAEQWIPINDKEQLEEADRLLQSS